MINIREGLVQKTLGKRPRRRTRNLKNEITKSILILTKIN